MIFENVGRGGEYLKNIKYPRLWNKNSLARTLYCILKIASEFRCLFSFWNANKLELIYFPIGIPFLKVIFHLLTIIRKISVLKINKMFGKNSDFFKFCTPLAVCIWGGGGRCSMSSAILLNMLEDFLRPNSGSGLITLTSLFRRDWTYRSDLCC